MIRMTVSAQSASGRLSVSSEVVSYANQTELSHFMTVVQYLKGGARHTAAYWLVGGEWSHLYENNKLTLISNV